jgi:hypothetical protein
MRLRTILALGLVCAVTACAEKEQAASVPAGDTAMAAPDVDSATAVDEVWQNEAFVEHMHLHAERLDDLNFALADEDLEAAKAAADWLATHDTDSNIQSDWMPFLYRMRTDAEAVVEAPDIASAQAAAQRITTQCQECHRAAGINAQLNR